MLENGVRPTIFFYNPNIVPREEYARRKAESIRHAASLGLAAVDGDYDHPSWLAHVRGLEDEPERGRRCAACFAMRLAGAARYAHAHGFAVFATTLGASRWKNLSQVNEAGRRAASHCPGLVFWEQDWRKGGLSERRAEVVKAYQFYSQTYCGCEFSI
jgi:predicted adenine nucleotide alpha hydrolase (AANH) superfamily ATPase